MKQRKIKRQRKLNPTISGGTLHIKLPMEQAEKLMLLSEQMDGDAGEIATLFTLWAIDTAYENPEAFLEGMHSQFTKEAVN